MQNSEEESRKAFAFRNLVPTSLNRKLSISSFSAIFEDPASLKLDTSNEADLDPESIKYLDRLLKNNRFRFMCQGGPSLATQRKHILATHSQILKRTFSKLRKETKRVGLNSKLWRCTTVNRNFTLCSSYPPYLIVPAQCTDDDLREVARYRHFGRIPAVVWRYRKNGAVIVRCSQPSVGLLGRRSTFDEKLIACILENCALDDLDDDDFFEINVCEQQHIYDSNGKPKENTICSHNYCDNCINHCFADKIGEELSNLTNTSDESTNRTNELNNSQDGRQETIFESEEENLQKDVENTSLVSDNKLDVSYASDRSSFQEIHFNTSCRCECHERQNGATENISCTRTKEEEERLAKSRDKRLLILDARSFTVAFLNRAMGGGSECAEYYPNCDVDYLYLANIHSVRTAFFSVRALCDPNNAAYNPNYFPTWTKGSTNYWLYYLSNLIESALRITKAMCQEARPVLVHCSDGWDRTPQLISLAQIMMDPYFRTIQGFQQLVKKDWLEFGHKFSDRLGVCPLSKSVSERSPIFLQWLDCVHQLVKQFPDWFEFNLSYLEELAFHTYSPLFGTFFGNNYLERFLNRIYTKSNSVWRYLDASRDKFLNGNYIETDKVMAPSYDVVEMVLWKELYSRLIDDDFLARFDLRSSPQVDYAAQMEDYNFTRRRRLFRTVSLDYISRQMQNEKQVVQNGLLRQFKSEPCLPSATSEESSSSSACEKSGPYIATGRSTSSLLNINARCKSNTSSNNNASGSGSCGELPSDLHTRVPLSVISKIAQVANSNPDSSLMCSILSYVSSLYTFSVK